MVQLQALEGIEKNLRAHRCCKMTPEGFEPTQLALVELESTPLDHSGKVSLLVPALRFMSLRSTKGEGGRQAGRQAGKH